MIRESSRKFAKVRKKYARIREQIRKSSQKVRGSAQKVRKSSHKRQNRSDEGGAFGLYGEVRKGALGLDGEGQKQPERPFAGDRSSHVLI